MIGAAHSSKYHFHVVFFRSLCWFHTNSVRFCLFQQGTDDGKKTAPRRLAVTSRPMFLSFLWLLFPPSWPFSPTRTEGAPPSPSPTPYPHPDVTAEPLQSWESSVRIFAKDNKQKTERTLQREAATARKQLCAHTTSINKTQSTKITVINAFVIMVLSHFDKQQRWAARLKEEKAGSNSNQRHSPGTATSLGYRGSGTSNETIYMVFRGEGGYCGCPVDFQET